MSQTQGKDSLKRGSMDPSALLKSAETLRRLKSEGILRPTGDSQLWKAIIKSPFGKHIGLTAVRVVQIPPAFGTGTYPVSVFLLNGEKHPGNKYFRIGDYIAVSQRQLAEIVTSYTPSQSEETFACVSQIGDTEVDLSPLEAAEFDFRHCPRIWCEENQTYEFDSNEYFVRVGRLNDLRRAGGMPACPEGVTPSTYG